MLSGRHSRKAIAATLLLTFFSETFAPSISYALTSGPTQPEATSFEPVDTTDMVNMQTGDFVYNIPLLDVLGPDGSYPLSLSYHGGIQTNVDASWVGLGWTLNPGAIARSVNGFPDDWLNQKGSSHTFWSGGNTTTYSAGVNIGIAESPYSVSFGLSVSQDTYKGFGVGFTVGFGMKGMGGPSGMNSSIGVGVAPYSGKASVSYGISQISPVFGGLNVSNGVTLSTNFNTVQASASGGVGFFTGGSDGTNYSLLGASISSNGNLSYSVGAAGFTSSVASSKIAGVQTATNGFSLTVPISSLVSVSLGYTKTRYWTNETSSSYIEGSYYPVGSTISPYNYDVYSLLDDPSILNIAAFPDPTVLQGGTYPSYDDYQVTAQGLSGDMRPFGFEEALTTQNTVDANNNPLVTSAYLGQPYLNDLKCFRFENDFSNSYRQNLSNEYAAGTTQTSLPTDEPPFDPNPAYGNNDGQFGISINSSVGTSVMNPALAGSRHIDIGVKVNPSHIYGYNPGDQYKSGMFNGFSITNESGVTYHYGLPAYSYGEQNYQQKISQTNGLFFNRSTKNIGYAYTWYLTSITGPDYVDRNGDGFADEGDWGYWVNFEYGKWSNRYVWRNPAQGYTIDDDNNFEDCSQGYKEVYYLNAIRTRSNIAIFEKDVRQDGKGVEPETFYQNYQNDQNGVLTYTNYQNAGGFDINSSQSMQLSHIYLLPIADSNLVLPNSSTNATIYTPSGRTVACSDCELPLNVIDANDVNQVGRYALISKAIRVIDFNYNYSLCPNTANSYNISTPSVLNGKLTLSSVVTRGVAGANLIPPVTFGYDLTGSDIKSQTGVTLYPASGSAQAYFTTTSNIFNQGDMIMETTTSPAVYCGLISGPPTQSGGLYTYTLANGSYTGGIATVNIQTTKNPPYKLNCFDGWGMYKGDADSVLLANNANMGRATTAASAPATDAWSLRYIYSPFGDVTKINYQPDSYHTSIMNNTYSYVMQNIVQVGTLNDQISFTLATYGSTANPASLLTVGEYLPNILLAINYNGAGPFCSGYFRHATPSSVIGGLTINSIVTSGGVTTITGTTDHTIPQTWGGSSTNIAGIASGNLWINYTGDYLGGGIRVQSITANHSLDNTSSTLTYNYNNPTTGYSSGVTSYLPTGLDAYDGTAMNANSSSYCNIQDDINLYLTLLYGNINAVYPISRELPAPGVMYQYVTVTNQVKNPDEASARNIEGSTRYQFEVLQPGMVIRDALPPLVYSGMNVARNWAIRKFTSGIGSLKRVTQYDVNGVMLSQTINHYLHDNLESQGLTGDNFFTPYLALLSAAPYNYQGFIQERYADVKTIAATYLSPTAPGYLQVYLGGARASLSGRESYPCILTGQTVINYVNGTQTSTSNLAFDYYSGEVTRTLETDSYGNNIMTETVPAYREYPAMGLKINVDANKNMLTQVAETKTWKVDANIDTLELASANVTTWSDNVPVIDLNGNPYTQNNATTYGDIWRPQSGYSYLSAAQTQTADGLTPVANFNDFDWTTPSSSAPGWKNTSNILLYDVYSKGLEQNDVNGNYASVHMDYGDQHVILTGSPANFYEMAFSGAEDANITQTSNLFVNGGSGTIATVAHTGAQSLLLGTSGVKGFTYSVPTSNLVAGRTYKASVWVKPAAGGNSNVGLYYDINGTIQTSVSSTTSTQTGTNSWVLVNLVIPGSAITPGNTLNVWCRNDNTAGQAYVDDFRFQPQNATTTAYVYDPVTGQLDYMLDNNDVYTEYTYDGAGRLLKVIKEKVGFGIYMQTQNEYAYGAGQWYNAAINNVNYTKNNCPIYTTPSTTAVTVAANMFNSFFSLGDANSQAQAYAQDYANVNGTCACAPVFSFASGITVTENQISGPAPNITYAFAFTWPTGNTTVNLGNVLGSCAYPTSTRTVPFIQGSTVYNLTVSTTGNVEVSVMSGPAPSGTWGTTGYYNINQNAIYSDPESNSFQRTNCGSGYTGSYVTYSVPQYAYNSLVNVAAADQLAINAMDAAGPTYANTYGTCTANCSFTWASGINGYSATIGSSGTTGSFSINFLPETNGWSSGTLGTIVGSACIPTSTQTVYVTDGSNSQRTWQVTISTNGSVSVRQQGGPATTTQGAPIQLKGTYTD